MRTYYFIICICLFLIILPVVSYGQFVNLSSYFIDSTSSPLFIYNNPFPYSVIYQNNIMYAPAPEYANMLGISSDFQKLPNQLILNGNTAPISLLAVGPDRYTGKSIYYLNVTATLDFLGINYTISKQDSKVQVIVNKALSQPTAVMTCSISGRVMNENPFQEGSVTLSEEYINDARIPSVRIVNNVKLFPDGKYSFTGLAQGKYIVKALCVYRTQSDILYNQVTREFYYIIRKNETTYVENITLKSGENVTLNLNNGKTVVSEQINYIYTPYFTPHP